MENRSDPGVFRDIRSGVYQDVNVSCILGQSSQGY